jgi:Uma2 family endonuclease
LSASRHFVCDQTAALYNSDLINASGAQRMATPKTFLPMSAEQYLAFERAAEERHEFANGRMYAMAGESLNHSTVCFNIAGRIFAQLVGKSCRGFSPNMKVCVSETGRYYYPDLSIACGEPVFHDDYKDVLLNPTVVIEVLSPSTEKRDRSTKLLDYQSIASLQDYLLIAQDQPVIEHYSRQADGRWWYQATRGLDNTVEIPSIACRLVLAEVYDRIIFPPPIEEDEPEEEYRDPLKR